MTLKNNGSFLLYDPKLSASFQTIGEFKLELQSGNAQFRSKLAIFWPPVTLKFDDGLKNNRASILCCSKLCASFHSHYWIKTGVTVRKHSIWVEIDNFISSMTLKFDGWPWKNNRAPLLGIIKLCASFHHNMWNQTGVTVRKGLSWVLTSVTLIFYLWPWPFAWNNVCQW